MDPATIVQIVGTAVSLGDVVIKCIAGLRTLKSKYHDAPLIISTIIGQLYMVQAALDQLAKWNKPEHDRDPRYQQLAQQIDNSIDCFGPLVTSLEQRLKDFELTNENDMTTTQRLAFLWDEQETSDFSILLDRQVNAFNLLLQAVQCNTLAQQQDLLLREQSQSILQQAKDCSSSIVGLEDRSSYVSENSAGISLAFDFDAIVLASRIYQKAERSHLRQAIKAHNQASAQEKLKQIPAQDYPDNFPLETLLFRINRHNASGGLSSSSTKPALQVNNMPVLPLSMRISRERSPLEVSNMPVVPKSMRIDREMSHRKTSIEKKNRLASPWKSDPKTTMATQRTSKSPLKLLILGTSESGKSAVLQGLKLILHADYTKDERMHSRGLIWSNAVMGTRVVLEDMASRKMPLSNYSGGHHLQTICMQPTFIETTPDKDVVEAISSLWRDESFKSVYDQRNENESVAYYARHIQRLTSPDYIPTNEDILYTRRKTIGIKSSTFSNKAFAKNLQCEIFDVGGVRSERTKWTQQYEGVSVVLFTVDTTAYAKRLFEDQSVSRMKEQLEVWSSTVNSPRFVNTAFVLIFTKLDMLEELMRREPVASYLNDCPYLTNSGGSVDVYTQYLVDKFLLLVDHGERVERIRIVQGNLVHDSAVTTLKIIEAINDLVVRYPAVVGVLLDEEIETV